MNEGLLTEYVQTKSYYEALLEVHSVRGAPEYPPRWSSFDADNTWYEMLVHDWPGHGSELALDISRFRLIPPLVLSSCCASRFTWASTSDSEAQEARDKHNCRSCGTLVCDPCSTNRVPIPSIGITVTVRVCDRCYHDIPCRVSAPSHSVNVVSGQRVRRRDRRSAVVDELASRVQRPNALVS
jgi:FYVE zinc finger